MTLEQPNCSTSNPENEGATVLVTGGAGFIGSHLVDALLNQNCNVTVIDDVSTGLLSNLPIDNENLTVLTGSVTEKIKDLDPSFDAIYHLAAAVGVKLVVDEPIRTIETNIHETSAILRFAAQRLTPTLLASTSEVYGKSESLPMREDGDLVFGATTKSRWSYGCSKALDEHLATAWYRKEGLPVRIPRFFNTIGTRQRAGFGMVVPRFIKAALEGDPLVVYGDGSQTRCFCDVRDTVPMILKLMQTDASIGECVNVGSDEVVSIGELAALIISTLESNSEIQFVPMHEVYGQGFEDLRDRKPDLQKLRSCIEVNKQFTIEDTIVAIAESFSTGATQ
ncbi:MAG: GDP-mannose 4,6-dehydratase [Phycisphaerales bacterium]|jgi:UDP-glucose 4-epimerase|nr:GDP-mannose 4,6-dehydratase [Phycisphaerales bacterium]